jgi:hypothetical protein
MIDRMNKETKESQSQKGLADRVRISLPAVQEPGSKVDNFGGICVLLVSIIFCVPV